MLAISLNPVDWVTDAAGWLLEQGANSILDGIVSWLEDGMNYVAKAIGEQLAGLSTLDLGSQTAQQMGGVIKWVALAVTVASIMVAFVMAAFGGEGSLHDAVRETGITLVLLAGWFGLMSAWTEAIAALMSVWTTDALVSGLSSGISLDPGIASFVRGFVALMMLLFFIIFFIELLVLNHMLLFGVLIGQVAIALRPIRPLRGVSGQMIRNVVTLSLVPALSVGSLSLALGRFNEAGALSFTQVLAALAGIVVSVLMPMVVAKFLPLGGQSSSAGRGLIGAAAAAAGTAALVATGGAAAAGGLSKFVTSGAGPAGLAPGNGTTPPPTGVAPTGGTPPSGSPNVGELSGAVSGEGAPGRDRGGSHGDGEGGSGTEPVLAHATSAPSGSSGGEQPPRPSAPTSAQSPPASTGPDVAGRGSNAWMVATSVSRLLEQGVRE